MPAPIIYLIILLGCWVIFKMVRKSWIKDDVKAKAEQIQTTLDLAEEIPEVDDEKLQESRDKISDFQKK